MSDLKNDNPESLPEQGISRRHFLKGAGGLFAAAAVGAGIGAALCPFAARHGLVVPGLGFKDATEPFLGAHQGGIVTSPQNHTYFAAFDLTATKREEVVKLLQAWTEAAARMAKGKPAQSDVAEADAPPADSGEAVDLPPARLTLTFGFSAGLFSKDGHDRYGLAGQRPAALVDMPAFTGDQLQDARTGGDISVQACADDPQLVFHAVRQLARIATGTAQIRWVQSGFISKPENQTPRNLMGFRDGTESPSRERKHENNPEASSDIGTKKGLDEVVWVGAEGPDWMQGGTYLVARRIRMALEHWDTVDEDFQEQVVGRKKRSGAPLGGAKEFDELNLALTDKDGNPVIPENAHVRLATAASNDGAQILRRGYSYNDGINFIAERWPPWRQGLEYDAGLLFLAYQRDPRTGFIKIFEKMSKMDALNQFVTHTGGGLFAIPAGVKEGEFIGQRLFKAV